MWAYLTLMDALPIDTSVWWYNYKLNICNNYLCTVIHI